MSTNLSVMGESLGKKNRIVHTIDNHYKNVVRHHDIAVT